MGTPIINLPQTAVLGLHAIKDKAVVVNGKIEIRPVGSLPFHVNAVLTVADDVPCTHLRPSFTGWQGGCDFLGEGQGFH